MIDQIIDFNKSFVAQKGYEKYLTDKYPDKKLAVLSCMDTRLTELLPAALGLKNGDAKIIKNAGGLVISAFDSAMRSLIVAIYELGVQEIMVVAHSHCGACHMSYDHFHHEMIARGVTDETLDTIRKCGIDLDQWLEGFKDTPTSVRKTVETIKTHPLVPKDIVVRGFIIDSETGALEEIEEQREQSRTCSSFAERRMRKASRQMDAAFALEVLDKAPYVTVSMMRPDGSPYGLPLSLARTDEKTFYFHCALEGDKLDCIAHNPTVFLSAVTKCAPTVGPKDGSFTLQYKSATAIGKAEIVTDREEKITALRAICQRFLPHHMDAFDDAISRSLERTAVVKITLQEPPVGKRKQYDKEGEELKWGRME